MSDAEMSRFTRPRKLGERETIRSLLPYLWPRNEMELRVRVVAAIVCLFIAKIANVYVPVLYKHAIDALGTTAGTIAVLPVGLLAFIHAGPFLELWIGEEFDGQIPELTRLMRLFLVAALPLFIAVHVQVSTGLGRLSVVAIAALAGAIVNLPLSYVLTLRLGGATK